MISMLTDNLNLIDHATKTIKDFDNLRSSLNTRIIFRNHATGKVLLETRNKLILPGSGLIAHKIFDILGEPEAEITPSYNDKISGLIRPDNPSTENIPNKYTNANSDNHKVLLFCVGTDGCGAEASQVYSVNYKNWCDPSKLVPFKYGSGNGEDAGIDRTLYFGKTIDSANNKYMYYFKRFNNFSAGAYGVTFKQVFENGTNINANVYDNTSPEEIYTYVELSMSIDYTDCIDFINAKSAGNNINTLQLCTAYPVYGRKADSGDTQDYIYFNDIRPITKLNFSNEIITGSKSIDITYQIYF